MTARYAIYYAPEAGSALWIKASAWLGRDAISGRTMPRPDLPALTGFDVEALTAAPRHYGFLAAGQAFAASMTAFDASIAPAALGRFLAFRLQDGEAQMQALHATCVRAFESYRAPLCDADLARRRRAPLTTIQDGRLEAWGYPYVFEDFRFHMTLTGSIADDTVRARVLSVLRDHFAAETGLHRFDAIAIFRQLDRAAPFDIIERVAFPASVAAETNPT